MEDNKDFPRYQYSIMFGSAREKQIVVRGADWESFTEDIKKVKDVVGVVSPAPAEQQGLQSTCPIHSVKMFEGHAKSDGHAYWYHKTDEGTYCYGKKLFKR